MGAHKIKFKSESPKMLVFGNIPSLIECMNNLFLIFVYHPATIILFETL